MKQYDVSIEDAKVCCATDEERKFIDDCIKPISKPTDGEVYMVIYLMSTGELSLRSKVFFKVFASKESAIRFYDELIKRGIIADWTETEVYE